MSVKKPRPIARSAKGQFAKLRYARAIWLRGEVFSELVGKNLESRKKVLKSAIKKAKKPTFNEKISKTVKKASRLPTKKRVTSERKTLYVPGNKKQSFEIEKFYFETDVPIRLGKSNFKNRTNKNVRAFRKRFDKIFAQNRGRNFLFRLDTAFSNAQGFTKVTAHELGKKQTSKSGETDGRGYSIGRYLDVDTKKQFRKYIDDTLYGFFKAFDTYMGRKGMSFAQLNGMTLEVS